MSFRRIEGLVRSIVPILNKEISKGEAHEYLRVAHEADCRFADDMTAVGATSMQGVFAKVDGWKADPSHMKRFGELFTLEVQQRGRGLTYKEGLELHSKVARELQHEKS